MTEQKTVIVSGKAVADFAAVAVAIATGASQFLRDEKSYEVLFLAFAFLCLYGFVKFLMNRVEELKALLESTTNAAERRVTKLSEDYTANINTMQRRHERYVQISNATIANLFSDVSSFAGSRVIGSLNVDSESGAMIYIKATTPQAPGGIERRGVPQE